MDLVITGKPSEINEFLKNLIPNNEKLTSASFKKIINKTLYEYGNEFDGFILEKKNKGGKLIITWSGGFGGFDSLTSDFNLTFKNDLQIISEIYPKLEFRIYFDSALENFIGTYSHEIHISEGSEFSYDCFAGGVAYKNGVVLGECAIEHDEYFTNLPNEDEVDDFFDPWNFFDSDKLRKRIDQKIESGNLCNTTKRWRRNWQKNIISDGVISIKNKFLKEIPLAHSNSEFIDYLLAKRALELTPYSICFIPQNLITSEMRQYINEFDFEENLRWNYLEIFTGNKDVNLISEWYSILMGCILNFQSKSDNKLFDLSKQDREYLINSELKSYGFEFEDIRLGIIYTLIYKNLVENDTELLLHLMILFDDIKRKKTNSSAMTISHILKKLSLPKYSSPELGT